ncbi:GNAT family N-acetyltransferase [uncultured Eubacterium sp.]|uniref:GNAT family N-acetyltransferase n=1 Tax=uncultured Eubacterium sp. TaxID=165185 RepID=UPI00261988C4|nr:GNAT family N-acetyltransferase [uncultured Eubacterium sp.]
MIKITQNANDIVPLWNEAFGDSKEDIVFFIENIKNARCFAYFKNGKAVSMLYLVDCALDGKQSHYIYAACTTQSCRKKGYMSALIEHCIAEFDEVCLIPANEKLIEYYKRQGLNFEYSVDKLKFDECKELVDEYLYAGCSLDTPLVLSNKGE